MWLSGVICLCLSLATLVLAPVTTHADTGQWYLGGGPSFSWLEPDTGAVAGVSVADDTDVGGKVLLGYDLTKHWSLEAFFAIPGEAGISPQGTVDYEALYGLGAIFSLPNTGPGFSGFVKAGGVGLETAPGNVTINQENDGQIFAGAGVRYDFGRGWGLRLEYDYFFDDVQLATLSLVKRFGSGVQETVVEPESEAEGPRLVVTQRTLGDRDDDGVPDTVDQCPGTPTGRTVDAQGCEPVPLGAVPGKVRFSALGLFAVNSAELTPAGKAGVQRFVQRLQAQYAEISAISVEGHTDSRGDSVYNKRLSALRADAVRAQLVAAGIDRGIITLEGFGETRPIASNATEQGRARNRRVEIRVTAIRR